MAHRPRKSTTAIIARLNRIAERDRLTNEQIAESIGVERTTVGKWRGLKRGPSNLLIRKALEKWLAAREKKAAR